MKEVIIINFNNSMIGYLITIGYKQIRKAEMSTVDYFLGKLRINPVCFFIAETAY